MMKKERLVINLSTGTRRGGHVRMSSIPEHTRPLWGLILPTAPWVDDQLD